MRRNVRWRFALGALALLAALAAGCGKKPALPDSAAPQSGELQVILRSLQFRPRSITVKAGTWVTFVNRDPMLHDVVQTSAKQVGKEEPGFASPPLETGQSWSIRMDLPGTYPVVCTQAAHYTAGMAAAITVVP